MHLQENTPAQWKDLISELTVEANTCDNEVEALTQQRDALSLDAELGQDGAARKLQKVLGEITAKQTAAANTRTAIEQAKIQLANAQRRKTFPG